VPTAEPAGGNGAAPAPESASIVSIVTFGPTDDLRSPLRWGQASDGSDVSDRTQDSGSWRAEDGTRHLPGGEQDPLASTLSQGHEDSTFVDATEDEGCAGPDDEGVKPVTVVTPVRRQRALTIRLGSDLDRGVWMWLVIIGGIVLIVLMIIAVSQVRSSPTKGRDAAAVEQVKSELSVTSSHAEELRAVDDHIPRDGRGEASIDAVSSYVKR